MAHEPNPNSNGAPLAEDLCGCQSINCSDCAEDAVHGDAKDLYGYYDARREGASEADAVDGETNAPTATFTGASEAAAVDGMWGEFVAPAKPYLPSTLAFSHMEIVSLDREITRLRKHIADRDAIIGRKVAYLTQLELAHADDHKRIENLTLTTRELEALIIKRDTSLMHEINEKIDAEARAESLQQSVTALENKIADNDIAFRIMSEVSSVATSDAEKYMDDARSLNEMLDDSIKRENHAYQTIAGVRALATSDTLTDEERIALILRLVG